MKHLLKMSDLTPDEVAHILDVADELKAQQVNPEGTRTKFQEAATM